VTGLVCPPTFLHGNKCSYCSKVIKLWVIISGSCAILNVWSCIIVYCTEKGNPGLHISCSSVDAEAKQLKSSGCDFPSQLRKDVTHYRDLGEEREKERERERDWDSNQMLWECILDSASVLSSIPNTEKKYSLGRNLYWFTILNNNT
jgi:hypothetical protein